MKVKNKLQFAADVEGKMEIYDFTNGVYRGVKYIKILLVWLCVFCLTGCCETENEIGVTIETSGESETEEAALQEADAHESEYEEMIQINEEEENLDESDSIEKYNYLQQKEYKDEISKDDTSQMDVALAWSYLKNEYFGYSDTEEISYDEDGRFFVVIGEQRMPFSAEGEWYQCESVVCLDEKNSDNYVFGHYYVYYEDNGDVYALKAGERYYVDCYTGEIIKN